MQFNILLVRLQSVRSLAPGLFDSSSAVRACLLRPPPAIAVAPAADREPTARRRFATVRGRMQAEVPVFVPCYNNPTYAQGMLAQLRRLGFRKVLLVDNASTSPDMRAWLEGLDGQAEVIALTENLGPRDIFLDARNFALLPRYFCVTDPDLELNGDLPEGFLGDLAALAGRHKVGKAGFALDVSEQEAMRDESFRIGERDWKIWEWERQFWDRILPSLEAGDPVYDAKIDTTFALYDKDHFDSADHLRAVRVAGRFTARHLPWYRDVGLPAKEVDQYRRTARYSFYLKDPSTPPPT
jgi:hypothetical protein